jgi:hypothetical protein
MSKGQIFKMAIYVTIVVLIIVGLYYGITALIALMNFSLFKPGQETQLAIDCSQSDSSLMECCKPGGELFKNVKKLYQDKKINLTDDQITSVALFFFCSGRKKDNLKAPPMCASHLTPPK